MNMCLVMGVRAAAGRFVATVGLVLVARGMARAAEPPPGPASNTVVRAGAEWIPLRESAAAAPGSALDFTGVVPHHRPAGKYGRVVAKGGHFEFEGLSGVVQRFYGVNLCYGANYLPDRAAARAAMQRLAALGYNAIRIHHYDDDLVRGSADCATLNTNAVAKLDALVAACVEEGLYVTTDLFVSRRVTWRAIGEDRDGFVPLNDYRQLIEFHPGAWSNYAAFVTAFLGHRNPYTGRRYAEEPALGWLSLINEGNQGLYGPPAYTNHPIYAAMWTRWLERRRQADPAGYKDVTAALPKGLANPDDPQSRAFTRFLAEIEMAHTRRTRELLAGLGARQPVSSLCGWANPMSYQLVRNGYDYVENHFYVDLPGTMRLPSHCRNLNPVRDGRLGVQETPFRALLDKPLMVTEFNHAAPASFRAADGLMSCAMAGLQDWGAMWKFAWSHGRAGFEKESTPTTFFDVSGDPVSLANDRVGMLLFLRGDVAALAPRATLLLPRAEVLDRSGGGDPRWRWIAWYAKFRTAVVDADKAPPDAGAVLRYPADMSLKDDALRARLFPGAAEPPPVGGGQVVVDDQAGRFLVTTPRTAGGFAERGGWRAGPLAVELDGGGSAAVWAGALDGRPLRDSRRILLAHVTDAQNTGCEFVDDAKGRTLLKWGTLPHLVRAGKARVSLDRAPGTCRVYALATSGARLAEVPAGMKDGRLSFTVDVARDPAAATLYYEIAEDLK